MKPTSARNTRRLLPLLRLILLALAIAVGIWSYRQGSLSGTLVSVVLIFFGLFLVDRSFRVDRKRDEAGPKVSDSSGGRGESTLDSAKTSAEAPAELERRPEWILGGFAALLCAIATLGADANRLSLTPLWFWMAAQAMLIVSVAVYWRRHSGGVALNAALLFLRAHLAEFILILVLTGVALFVRAYDLSSVPPAIHGDEAEPALQAMDIAMGRSRLGPFVTGWYDLPTLHQYGQALFLQVFGPDISSIRLMSVLMGTLCVPLTYLIGRAFWGKAAGAVGAWILAVNHLHIAYSRIVGYLEPLVALLLIVACLTYARHRKPWVQNVLMAIAGAAAGLCLYTYYSNRLTILVGATLLVLLTLRRQITLKAAGVFVAVTLIAIAPLLLFQLQHPDTLFNRSDAVNVFDAVNVRHTVGRDNAKLPDDLLPLLGHQVTYTLGMFVFMGDASKYSFDIPAFDPLSVVVCWLGLGMVLTQAGRFARITILFWFASAIVAGGIISLNPPSAQKLIMAVPPFALAGGFLVSRVWRAVNALVRLNLGALWIPFALVGGIWQAQWNINKYFVVYPPRANGIGALEAAKRFAIEPDRYDAYFMGAPAIYANYSVFRLVAYGLPLTEAQNAEQIKPPPADKGLVVVALVHRKPDLAAVKARFPAGASYVYIDSLGRELFEEYRVPPGR